MARESGDETGEAAAQGAQSQAAERDGEEGAHRQQVLVPFDFRHRRKFFESVVENDRDGVVQKRFPED